MKIHKIKSTRPGFSTVSGPEDVVTIGFRVEGGDDYILGTVYRGAHEDEEQNAWFDDTEAMIDELVRITKGEPK